MSDNPSQNRYSEKKENKFDFLMDFILFIAISVLIFIIIKPFFTALLFALLTAYSLKPLVDLIKKVVKSYVLSLLLTIMLIIIPTGVFVYYAASGTASIIEKTNEIMLSLNNLLYVISDKASQIPILQSLNVPEHIMSLQSLITEVINSFKISLIDVFQNIPKILISVLVYLLATYYFIIEGDSFNKHYEMIVSSLSKRRQIMLNAIFKGLKNALDVLVISYITLTIIITVLAYIIYYAFSIPYAIVWAVLTGLFGLLPILGCWMVYGGVSFYLYLKGKVISSIIVLIYGLVVLNIFPDVVLRPVLGSYKSKVHPLLIFLGFFGGPMVFGIAGFILGPIIMIMGATVIAEYYKYYILSKNK